MPAWMGRKLDDFGALWPAEKRVATEMWDGRVVVVGKAVPPEDAPEDEPEKAPKDYHLRASFVRYLALGGCAKLPVPDKGVRIRGALIYGDGPKGAQTKGLDLEGATLPGDIWLAHCRFADPVLLPSCNGKTFGFNGSHLAHGLSADGLIAGGDVVLNGVTAKGEVRLLGAQLGGFLSCNGAGFEAVQDKNGVWGDAFSADWLVAQGSVFMRGVTATGAVRLAGAQLGSSLECDGASFEACGATAALNLQNLVAKGVFFWRDGAKIKGLLSLNHARFGAICDDAECWPDAEMLDFGHCHYGSFAGNATPVTAKARLKWLALQWPYGEAGFLPQPYEQCAKVLRSMGHGAEARAVLIEKEKLQRAARRVRFGWIKRNLYRGGDGLLGLTVDYGRRPLKAFLWLLLFWGVGFGVFELAARQDAVKPNAVYVLRSPEWVRCGYAQGELRQPSGGRVLQSGLAAAGQSQLDCYLARDEARNYPVFTPWVYSADTLLPIVDLEMQAFWIPDESKPFGKYARWYLWFQIFAGWGLSLLAVAGFSGLIKTDNTT